MENNDIKKPSKDETIHMYNEDVQKLLTYVPWLESKKGINMTTYYTGDMEKASLAIPTYDPTLLSFVKLAKQTNLIDKNYQYIYSKYYLRTIEDEWKAIENARISDMPVLRGILSKYILKGMIQATVWNEGVTNQVYLRLLNRLKDLMETWDQPLA